MSKQEFDYTLKTVIFQIPIPTVIYIDEKIHDCNKAFLELFEVDDKQKILGISPYSVFCSGNNHLNGTRYDVGVKGSKHKKIELKAKTFKGKIIYVVIHEANIIYENQNAVIAQIFDITKYKETELRLRTLINATPDIICFKDGEGRWIEANDADLKLFSLENVDYRGKKDSELAQYTHSIYRGAFLTCEQTDEIAWLKGTLSRNEEIIPLPDGSSKVYDVIKVPLFNEDGTRKGLVVLGRDITDLKNTQKKLEKQLNFSQVLNKIAEKIIAENDKQKIFEFIVDIVLKTLKVDQCKVFRANLKSSEILPIAAKIDYSAIEISFHKESYSLSNFPKSCEFLYDKKGFIISDYQNINQLLIEEKSHELVHNYYKIKTLLWYPISTDPEGFYFIVLNSIKEQHKWDEVELNFIKSVARLIEIVLMKLKIMEEREQSIQGIKNLATIIAQSINAVILADINGKIEYVNPAFEKLSGYEIKEIINKDIFNLYKFLDKTSIYNKILNGNYWSGKITFTRKDGKKIIEEAFIFPIKDSNNNITNICKISNDITKDIEMEEYIKHLQKMEAIGNLAAGIAHDFNNILTIINGYSELALNSIEKESKLYNHIFNIYQAGLKGEKLTKQLLAFGKKQIIKPEIVNINEILVSLLEMLRRLISEDIKIELRISEKLPPIKADITQLEQIFVNLVINARDAIKEKEKFIKNFEKTIIISTGIVKRDYFFESIKISGDYVYIFVSDTGIGMDDEIKKRVFEPFFTTKSKEYGTGLGLSTVYGIVKQNKGYIFIESEKEKGTTVKIFWPIAKKNEKKDKEKITDEKDKFIFSRKLKILIVEDDKNILNLLKEGLDSFGFKVFSAENGKEALKIIKRENIDIIITDVIMPEMNGRELFENVKKIKPKLKFIFISGYPEDELTEKDGSLLKNIEFIQKPFSLKEILIKIKEIIREGNNV